MNTEYKYCILISHRSFCFPIILYFFASSLRLEIKLSDFKLYVRTHASVSGSATNMRNHLFWLCIHFCHLPHHSYLNLVIITIVGHKKKNLWTPWVSSHRLLSLTANDNHENLFWPSMHAFAERRCCQWRKKKQPVYVSVRGDHSTTSKISFFNGCFSRRDIMVQRARVIGSSSFPVSSISFDINDVETKRRAGDSLLAVLKHMCITAYYTQQHSVWYMHVWRQKSGLYFPHRICEGIYILWLSVLQARHSTFAHTIQIFKRKHWTICEGLNVDLHSGNGAQCTVENDIQYTYSVPGIHRYWVLPASECTMYVCFVAYRNYAFFSFIFYKDFLFLLFFSLSLSNVVVRSNRKGRFCMVRASFEIPFHCRRSRFINFHERFFSLVHFFFFRERVFACGIVGRSVGLYMEWCWITATIFSKFILRTTSAFS